MKFQDQNLFSAGFNFITCFDFFCSFVDLFQVVWIPVLLFHERFQFTVPLYTSPFPFLTVCPLISIFFWPPL